MDTYCGKAAMALGYGPQSDRQRCRTRIEYEGARHMNLVHTRTDHILSLFFFVVDRGTWVLLRLSIYILDARYQT